MKQPCSILCGLLILCSLAACMAIGPTPTAVPTATAVPTPTAVPTATEEARCYAECISGLHIELDGATTPEYELELTWEGGHTDRVRCAYGGVQAEECSEPCNSMSCYGTFGDRGARWAGWLGGPNIVTVTVTWDGNQIAERIEPNYEEFYACGDKPPPCYSASVTITLPESP
jgi:hypothetical protein